MRTLIVVGVLACSSSVLALSGVQPVVVIYATRNTPAYTLDQVRTNALNTADMVARSSYNQYTLDVQAFGPFRVPFKTASGADLCRYADEYGRLAEQAAANAGVVFPSGVQPWIHSDCGHQFLLYTSSIPGAKRGLTSDGKMQGFILGLSLGMPVAVAEVIPYIGTNPFDPYTPMGYMPKGDYNAHERWFRGWLSPTLIRADAAGTPSAGTLFLEATEVAPTTRIKLWRLSNGIEIDARALASGSTKTGAAIVTLHNGGTSLIDLDRVNLCRWYTLTPGQIYTLGDGIGIRTDSVAADGATVTVYPYTGPITARCATGSK